MIDRDLEGPGGARHYSRWPDPWRPEDDWGPIIAAVMFLIILGGLIVSVSGVHLYAPGLAQGVARVSGQAPNEQWQNGGG
jgi:hypothetical protein